MGFPTANLEVWEQHALPGRGVYAACAYVQGTCYPAAVNIGFRPTVTSGERLSIEAHLLDFDGDLYGQEIQLDILGRIRNERRFDGLAQLVDQLARDIEDTRCAVAAFLERTDGPGYRPSSLPSTYLANASAVQGSAGQKNSR